MPKEKKKEEREKKNKSNKNPTDFIDGGKGL
jgi:hypothetical protein